MSQSPVTDAAGRGEANLISFDVFELPVELESVKGGFSSDVDSTVWYHSSYDLYRSASTQAYAFILVPLGLLAQVSEAVSRPRYCLQWNFKTRYLYLW